jgi:FO synthase
MGYASTVDYLVQVCGEIMRGTGLLPHVNAGVLEQDELIRLREVSVSMGLMLETASDRLSQKGGPHYRSPDKEPAKRLESIRLAGELGIPFTSGILIGIGETRRERLEALFALRELHDRYGHIQEIIIQNFRAKPRTPMAEWAEPSLDDLLWTIACARLIFGPVMNIQAPPNLSRDDFPRLMEAGLNDWGGVSPLTPDYVNPEAPWPELDRLAEGTAAGKKHLVRRLPIYPAYIRQLEKWVDPKIRPAVLRKADADGWSRSDTWHAGSDTVAASCAASAAPAVSDPQVGEALRRAEQGEEIDAVLIRTLFRARGGDVERICDSANTLRKAICGDEVSYVVNRNINYTNICAYSCGFCAFSKGPTHDELRGQPYDLDHAEIARRVKEAVARGASEVCLQGGIHPRYTGQTYLDILRTVKTAEPSVHVHAFSPLEISHGAETLGLPVVRFLELLRDNGLDTLPGTAAEILVDEVRRQIAPDKINSEDWLSVIETAHKVGLKTTSTIMFGHLDHPDHWASHLLAIRDLQKKTGGITEFVPLPFVHMEAPLSKRGRTRLGPTFREVRLMHAIARLVLHPHIRNIQVSWTKLGPEGARICLDGGANDLGGTLMNESISRAAGSKHGQEFSPHGLERLIRSIGRIPAPRTTLYAKADPAMIERAKSAPELTPIIQTPSRKRTRISRKIL